MIFKRAHQLTLLLSCFVWFTLVNAANILAVYPTASYSHQIPMLSLARALAEKGHNLTVITPNPFRTSIPNYTEIDISFTYNYWKSQGNANETEHLINLQTQYKSGLELMIMYIEGANKLTDYTLASPQVQKFIKYLDAEKPKFDLVLYEDLAQPAFVGFLHMLGHPPLITLITLPLLCSLDMASGNICNPTFIPDMIFSTRKKMNFWERVHNLVMVAYTRLILIPGIYEVHDAIARKYFGADCPSLEPMVKNRSLHLSSSMWMYENTRPLFPNTIHVGPLHIGDHKPLPQDIINWISKGKQGFIYLSFGSNMKSASLDIDTRSAILAAFAKFPDYQIIWKWEDEDIIGLPGNVLCRKWLPQHDLLAHPDIQLFITQGGLQSLQEGVHYEVPMIGVPFFGDQPYNVRSLEKLGVGSIMEFEDITTESLYNQMYEILNNKKYKKAVQRASMMSKTQILSPRDMAVWWVEYVLKFEGNVDHLRPDWWHLTWYQYLGLDILFALISMILIAIYTVYKVISTLKKFLIKGKLKTQ